MRKNKDRMRQLVVIYLFSILTGCGSPHPVYEGLTEEDWKWIEFDFDMFNANKNNNTYPHYRYIEEDGTVVFMIFERNIYRLGVHLADSTISKSYKYHANGKLKSITSYYNRGGFAIGKEYHYDKKGRLIEVIDHDLPYTYTFDDIQAFIERENLQDYRIYRTDQGYTDDYSFPERERLWLIKASTSDGGVNYLIDGLTGEVLVREEFGINF